MVSSELRVFVLADNQASSFIILRRNQQAYLNDGFLVCGCLLFPTDQDQPANHDKRRGNHLSSWQVLL
jgi:hypothetical protein